MLRKTRIWHLTIHSTRGVNFLLTSDEANERAESKYKKGLLSAQTKYMSFGESIKEFLPFYLCSGYVRGVYTGRIVYSETGSTNSNANSGRSSKDIHTSPQILETIFDCGQTQTYAGYKYNIANVHSALKSTSNYTLMQKMNHVDTTNAEINLFEQSIEVMREFIVRNVKEQATLIAESTVRSFHPTASMISITFSDLDIKINDVYPCFVPCFSIKLLYDGEEYTLLVSGIDGTVSGPLLLNALYVSRAIALFSLIVVVSQVANKVAGFIFGIMTAIVTYYIVFFSAKWYPSWYRNLQLKRSERLRKEYTLADRQGYRPTQHSQRFEREFSSSSYSDTHTYQQRQRNAGFSHASSSKTFSSTGFHSGADQPHVSDTKGYYKTLGLTGNESVNEIRSAYRKLVMKEHPDVGGSLDNIKKINEAYRVLRNTSLRAAYDKL